MNILIKQAIIVDSSSPYNLQKKDISIKNGKIDKIADAINTKHDQEVERSNMHISLGFLDMHCNTKNPGYEHKETIESLAQAALAGGYTHITTMPTTMPITQSKADIQFIKNEFINYPIHILPFGAITKNREGKELAELFDMHKFGAIAFSDGKKNIDDAGLLIRAIQYAINFNSLLIVFCDDKSISLQAVVNEGTNATLHGLKGAPALAEEIIVQRNIAIASYCNAPIHFTCLSSAKSIALIKDAKQKGIKVSCDVASHYLFFDDNTISNFDTNHKVYPPYRNLENKNSLIASLADGTIDAISSDHSPENIEAKFVEFELANNGITNLETAFLAALTACYNKVELNTLIEKFTTNPRKILGISQSIAEGNEASLTMFDPNAMHIINEQSLKSKSKNSPYIGKQLQGKIIGVINKNTCILN